MKREKSKFAGLKVRIHPDAHELGSQEMIVEDYWQNVYGKSWKISDGNPAAIKYAIRTSFGPLKVPLDDEVLYGKIGAFGHLVHVSEIEAVVVAEFDSIEDMADPDKAAAAWTIHGHQYLTET